MLIEIIAVSSLSVFLSTIIISKANARKKRRLEKEIEILIMEKKRNLDRIQEIGEELKRINDLCDDLVDRLWNFYEKEELVLCNDGQMRSKAEAEII